MLLSSNLFYVEEVIEKNRAKFFKDIKKGDTLFVQHSSSGEYIVKNINQKTERQVNINTIEQRFGQLKLKEVDLLKASSIIVFAQGYLSSRIVATMIAEVIITTVDGKHKVEATENTPIELNLNSNTLTIGEYMIGVGELICIDVMGMKFNIPRSDYNVQKQQA